MAIIIAAAIDGGFGQFGRDQQSPLLVGRSAGQLRSGATIRYADIRACNGRGAVNRGHPGQRIGTAPFEMHRHIGDQCARRNIPRGIAAQ